ncbi:MAG: 4Fe-4S binding protein, partial [Desulfuromonadales bacterium]|nr:4Fe-4S binding protein [Desulfuromonadales bacterium]NIS42569.1 4Fe-4S binding protein [Desulfuromonadales bacterium]
MAECRTRHLAPRRRAVQWSLGLLLVLVPFIRFDGRSLLRIDLDSLSLIAFGHIFRLEDLELALGLSVLLVLFFLLATLVLGRVWCGWACPQTA